MPTYEYECKKCGAVFEAFQRMTDRPLTKCKKCGSKGTVKRLVGAGAGVIFKGSGFYATDYKRSGAVGATEASEKKSETAEKPPEKSEKKEKTEPSKPKTSSSSEKSGKNPQEV
jgi:putative FmdB family regulatory protein